MIKIDPFLNSHSIPGWCWPNEIRAIYRTVDEVGSMRHVEIGSFCGKSLLPALKAMQPGGTIYSVDPLNPIEGLTVPDWEWVRDVNAATIAAMRRLRDDVEIIQLPHYSVDAARMIEGLVDTVYIDGNHAYEALTWDLETWIPKIRPGGVIFGHDFGNPQWLGVERAVQDLDRPFEVVPQTRVWKVQL